MKKILIILSKANATGLNSIESLSATLVFATFGHDVHVLLQDSALSLLATPTPFNGQQHAFKFGNNMLDSFDLYDIEQIYIKKHEKNNPFVQQSKLNLTFTTFDTAFIATFDHIIYW